jgi:hypothetical protein
MADKMTYFNDMRAAITNLLDAWAEVKRLRDFPTVIGWVQADFAGLLAGNTDGIDDAVFFDALDTRIPTLTTAFDSVDDYLSKFKP